MTRDAQSVPVGTGSSIGGTAPALRGGAVIGGTAPALRGGAVIGGTAPALRGGAVFGRLACALLAFCLSCAADSADRGHGAASAAGTGGAGAAPSGTGGATPLAGAGSGGARSIGDGVMHGSGGQIATAPGTGGGGAAGTQPQRDAAPELIDAPDSGAPTPMVWPALEASQIGAAVMVATGFSLAEGVLWDPCRGTLLFADVDNAIIHELTPPDKVGTFRDNSNYANGLVFDLQGRLLMAEMGPGSNAGRVTRLDRAGKLEVVVDKDAAGNALNTVDDLIVRSDGTIYFTDPVFPHGGTITVGLVPLPIYRLAADGKQLVQEGQTLGPNGVVLSPDEKLLYVASHGGGEVMRFDVGADGALTAGMPLAQGLTNPDSMCIDAGGNVYVGVNAGLLVLRPDGSVVTTVPSFNSATQGITNCGFGGADGTTLYFTSWNTLWRIDDMPIPGLDWQLSQRMPCN